MQGYHFLIRLSQSRNIDAEFTPAYLFQPLPSHRVRQGSRKRTSSTHQDYRFGPLRIDWVDFEEMSNKTGFPGSRTSSSGTASATFVPRRSKSGSTNLPEGTVHIFRDKPPSTEALEAIISSTTPSPSTYEDGVVLAILAVPPWMTPSEFLAFSAPAADGIAHLRIVRDSVPNRSIALIQFRQAVDAAEYLEAYNGKPFNSMEPERCNIVHVRSVQVDSDDLVSTAISRLGSAQGSVFELPTCPVCLERMDSAVTGLITVPCSHTFHCMCLSKWGDSRCPVCRYSQNLLSSHPPAPNTSRAIPFATSTTSPLSVCASCASTTNLWICLICGNIGCGRYGRAHAQAHYTETTHLYALELETQRVWDYAGDGYVHRLIQNKADGKLVELPSAAASMGGGQRGGDQAGMGPGPADALSAEKIEAIGIEYSYLLTSQLDSQRAFYEAQIGALTSQMEELRVALEKLKEDHGRDRSRAGEEEERRRKEMDSRAAEVEREKERTVRMAERAKKLERELREEKAVSEGLLRNLAATKARTQAVNQEKIELVGRVAELEDQVRDVMFFLEAKTKIEHGGGVESEAAGGSVELPPLAVGGKKKTKKK